MSDKSESNKDHFRQIPSHKSISPQNSSNLETRENLTDKRKSFFVDMNSNPNLQVTSV
jgi:secreted trypsin-like serine protease